MDITTYNEVKEELSSAMQRGELLLLDDGQGILASNGPDLARFADSLTPASPQPKILEVHPMLLHEIDEVAYAWTITTDHRVPDGEAGERWATGPEAISLRQLSMLIDGAPLVDGYGRYVFHLHGRAGERLFTGNAVFREKDPELSKVLAVPLVQFGRIEGGAERVTWDGHPEWDTEPSCEELAEAAEGGPLFANPSSVLYGEAAAEKGRHMLREATGTADWDELTQMVASRRDDGSAAEDGAAAQAEVSQELNDWLEALERRPKRSVSEMVREALTASPEEEDKPAEH